MSFVEELVSLKKGMRSWVFEYTASEIAAAAQARAQHHGSRLEYWTEKERKAREELKEAQEADPRPTEHYPSSGRQGYAYAIQTQFEYAQAKVREHRDKVELFQRVVRVMGRETDRKFSLTLEDVGLFKL